MIAASTVRMRFMRYCLFFGLLIITGCGSSATSSSDDGGTMGDAVPDATGDDDHDAGDGDDGDASCRPAGSPCNEAADMLTCCSGRCGPDEATQSGVCR